MTLLRAVKFGLAWFVCLSVEPAAAQVYRCTDKNGATAYQSTPCAGQVVNGGQVKLQVAPADPDAVARRAKAMEARASQPTQKPIQEVSPAAPPPPPPPKSSLELLSDICLDWYRPLLKDPRGAYYRDATYKDHVLTFTIYATNSYGGYVTNSAACEIKQGRIDEAWTKTHAKRHSWDYK